MKFNVSDVVYIKNKNDQQKRTKVLSQGFELMGETHYMIECSKVPVKESELSGVLVKDAKAKKFNCTRLDVEQSFERHVFHRDFFAHYLRWQFLLRYVDKNTKVLDFGCGEANLAVVLWANRHIPQFYKGYEYAQSVVDKTSERLSQLDWISVEQKDLTADVEADQKYDVIVSFEVVEHIGVDNMQNYLSNLKKFASSETTILISTPVYDHAVCAADNHVVNGEVNEFTREEVMKHLDDAGIEIVNQFGTFASQKDYKDVLSGWQKDMYENIKALYDVNILSNIMAVMLPEHSRNILYVCKLKQN